MHCFVYTNEYTFQLRYRNRHHLFDGQGAYLGNVRPSTSSPYELGIVSNIMLHRVEVNTGIIVVCAPTVKPAFTRYVWLSFLGKSPNNSSTGQSRSGGQSLPNNPNLPNSFEKTPRKKDFKKEQITTDHFIEHEMAQYGVRGFDEESGHGRSRSRSREANSASTSQRELAAGSDGEAEPQQQQPSGPS